MDDKQMRKKCLAILMKPVKWYCDDCERESDLPEHIHNQAKHPQYRGIET